mgnify:CR=1 FL=1
MQFTKIDINYPQVKLFLLFNHLFFNKKKINFDKIKENINILSSAKILISKKLLKKVI